MFRTITYLILSLFISFVSVARGKNDKLGAYSRHNKFTKDQQATKRYQNQLFIPLESSISGFTEDGQLCTFDENTVVRAFDIYNGSWKGRKGKWLMTFTSPTQRESRKAYAPFYIFMSDLSVYSPASASQQHVPAKSEDSSVFSWLSVKDFSGSDVTIALLCVFIVFVLAVIIKSASTSSYSYSSSSTSSTSSYTSDSYTNPVTNVNTYTGSTYNSSKPKSETFYTNGARSGKKDFYGNYVDDLTGKTYVRDGWGWKPKEPYKWKPNK